MNLQSLVLQVWLQTHTCAESHARPREKTQIPQVTWKGPSWEVVSSMASSRTTHVCEQRTCLLHGISHCAGTFVSALFVGRRCLTRRTRGRTWETAVALAPGMRTELSPFTILATRTTSDSHPTCSLSTSCPIKCCFVQASHRCWCRAMPRFIVTREARRITCHKGTSHWDTECHTTNHGT